MIYETLTYCILWGWAIGFTTGGTAAYIVCAVTKVSDIF